MKVVLIAAAISTTFLSIEIIYVIRSMWYNLPQEIKRIDEMEVIEKAPAKINLGYDVTNKRQDGYHEVETVMTSVDLADHLTFTAVEHHDIEIETENCFLPLDERNHIYQAVEQIRDYCQIDQGIHIQLQKRIPVAAGLAGGSSDAAATLRGLNELWQLHLTMDELMQLGAKIGSDVPYCLCGGTAYAKGRGDELEVLPAIPQCWVVLVKPKVSISTPKIFSEIDQYQLHHPDIQAVKQAVQAQDFSAMCQYMDNALEVITMDKCSQVSDIKNCMLKMQADAVVMSGSGPTMIALCKQYRKAQRIVNGLKGFCDEVYLVRTLM